MPKLNDAVTQMSLGYLQSKFPDDPEMVRKLTPPYPLYAKRPILDCGYYDALKKEHVHLVEGELKVTKNGRLLNLLTVGDCFGEMAAISKSMQTRGADITALTEVKIVTVKGDALRHASETCRMHFYQAFLEVMANRLALANARLAAI